MAGSCSSKPFNVASLFQFGYNAFAIPLTYIYTISDF